MLQNRDKSTQTEPQLPPEWFKLAEEAARQFQLPLPQNDLAPEEAERNLRQFEQRDGE
jgi:hypothetical protein